MWLVFPELIASILNLGHIPLGHPHVIAFVLAAFAVLMQWMWPKAVPAGHA